MMIKFNIYDYCSEDKKSILNGVYYNENYKIASDRINMVILNCQNNENKYKNKIIDKNGNFINGVFPNYKAIIPTKDKINKISLSKLQLKVGFKELTNLMEIGNSKYEYYFEFNANNFKIQISYKTLKLILEFLSLFPNAELYVDKESPNRKAIMFLDVDFLTEDENMFIFMPITNISNECFIYNCLNGIKYYGNNKDISIENLLSFNNKLELLKKHKENFNLKEKEYIQKLNNFLEIIKK